jgi:hypothetical protein
VTVLRAFLVLVTLTAISPVTRDAFAQADPKPGDASSEARAEAVFDDALEAFEAGRYEEACPKFASAIALTKGEGLGGKLLLASCYEKVNRPASAWALYREVLAKAEQTGQASRRAQALEGAGRVEKRLHYVELRISAEAQAVEGLTISIADRSIPTDAWGTPLPVDPGQTSALVEAPGYEPLRLPFDVPDAPGKSPLVIGAPAKRPPTAPVPQERGGLGAVGLTGIVLGSLGVVGMGVGIGVGLSAKSSWSDAVERDCIDADPARCTTTEGIDAARLDGDAASVTFGVGAGLAVAGLVLIVVDLTVPSSDSAPRVGFEVSPEGGMVGLGGTF